MSTPSAPREPRVLDVRALMIAGDHPFPKIAAALKHVGPGQTLLLITPFLPSPLIEKLQGEGFAARPERRSDGSWQTAFRRETNAS